MPAQTLGLPDMLSLTSLTDSINRLPAMPTKIGDSKLFTEEGISTTTATVEMIDGKISLVPDLPRDSSPTPVKRNRRTERVFTAAHLPVSDVLLPGDLQNLRPFGQVTVDQMQAKIIANRQQSMKDRIDATREFHRMGALRGQVLDADGSIITDLYTEFGVTKRTAVLSLGTATTDVRAKLVAVSRAVDQLMGGVMVTARRVYCSGSFFDALTGHDKVKAVYDNWQAAAEKLGGDMRNGFVFGGYEFVEYTANVSGQDFVPDGKAIAFPVASGLFKIYNAPANYNETVNTLGMPYYMKAEPRDFGKGYDLEAQSNPLALCTRPDLLTELSIS